MLIMQRKLGSGTGGGALPVFSRGLKSIFDGGNSIGVDSSGNMYTTGLTFGSSVGVHLSKYSSAGTLLWQKTLSTTGTQTGQIIHVTPSGDFYIGGTDSSAIEGIISKFDTDGGLLWQRSISTAGSGFIHGISTDSSGNVYAVGEGIDGSLNEIATLTKFNSSGTVQLTKTFNNNTNGGKIRARDAAIDSSGNIYIKLIVSVPDTPSTTVGYGVLKLDSSGNILWQRAMYEVGGFSGIDPSSVAIPGLALTSSGSDVYITGTNIGATDGATIAKINSSGVFQWVKQIESNSPMIDVAVDSSNNVYGIYDTATDGGIVKLDSSGNEVWQRELDHSSVLQLKGCEVDSSNLYMSGLYNSGVYIARIPTDGTGTGTFGATTYGSTSLTISTPNDVDIASTVAVDAQAITTATTSMSVSNTTLTETTYI